MITERSVRTSLRTSRCCSSSVSPGQDAPISCRSWTCPPWMPAEALGAANVRERDRGLPRSERSGSDPPLHAALDLELRASTWACIPLGSCTMKYNPRVNEAGGAHGRPGVGASLSARVALAQGAMEIMATLEAALAEITGMDAVTLQPAAGAHGECTGILLIRALLGVAGQPAQEDPRSRFGARHQSGDGGHRGLRRCENTASRTTAAWWTSAALAAAGRRRRRRA